MFINVKSRGHGLNVFQSCLSRNPWPIWHLMSDKPSLVWINTPIVVQGLMFYYIV